MQPTLRLLAANQFGGFWRRSLDEFKKQATFAIKLEALEAPKQSLQMWNFDCPEAVDACVDMADCDIGGYSNARMEYRPKSATEPSHVYFTGEISNKIPLGETEVERTGYAAFRTKDRPATMFGKSLWNVDRYHLLALRVKSDGRKYKVNVQTESLVYTDLHQHRLYAQTPGKWETILIRWRDFVRTNHGMVVEPQSEINKEKVRTIGIGLTDRLPGKFEISVSRIWSLNDLTPEEDAEMIGNEARSTPRHFGGIAALPRGKQDAPP